MAKKRRRSKKKPKATKRTKLIRKVVKSELRRTFEVKRRYDTASPATKDPSTPHWNWTIGKNIGQGVETNERIGTNIKILGVKFRTRFINTSTTHMCWLRVTILRLKLPQDVIAGGAEMFDNESNGKTVGDNYDAADQDQIWRGYNKRIYDVAYDKRIRLLPKVDQSRGAYYSQMNHFWKRRYNVQYDREVAILGHDVSPKYVLFAFLRWEDGNTTRVLQNFDLNAYVYFVDP